MRRSPRDFLRPAPAGSSPVVRARRPASAVLAALLAVILLSALAGSLYLRIAYGEWVPGGEPPPRLAECGRTYVRADQPRVKHPPASDVAVTLGAYPPVVGAPVRSVNGCDGLLPTGVYLRWGDGDIGYGLSGGP